MRNILEWLESSSALHKDKVAFADEREAFTFGMLHQKARAIGSALAGYDVRRKPVVFYMEKSPLCVAGYMGAVYAGGFYVALDPQHPKARIESILAALGATALCTDVVHYEAAKGLNFTGAVLCLKELAEVAVNKDALAAIRAEATDSDPVYAVFTSGSTGVPKGVVGSHRSLISFVPAFIDLFEIGPDDALANQAPFDFDVSAKDIYTGLAAGATVHLVPRPYFSSPAKLMDFLCERQVTTLIWAVSALVFVSTMQALAYRCPDRLRQVLFSGEVLPVKHLNTWRRALPDTRFVNLYGPTEGTGNCLYYIVDREFAEGENIPVGKPFPGARVQLLDEQGRRVEQPFVQGELYVGGGTLKSGYYKDPALTQKSFIQNPLHTDYMDTVYRTGDIAQYDGEGNLLFLSRRDHQIKYMGHRVELGEIETALHSVQGIERAACVYWQDKQRLLAFYEGPADKRQAARALKEKLPPFMLPGKLLPIEALPKTKNGKVDRNALLEGYIQSKQKG